MKRNFWRYAWPMPLLIFLGPRTFAWRRRVWCRWLPAWEAHPVGCFVRAGWFAVRCPRMWWFCRRLDLHYRFGFPLPLIEGRDFIRA